MKLIVNRSLPHPFLQLILSVGVILLSLARQIYFVHINLGSVAYLTRLLQVQVYDE